MNRNAYIGQNVETLFKNSIGDHLSIIQVIREQYKIKGRFLNAMKTGIHGEKADVKLGFACGHNIDVNVKAFKQTSAFNQLTRTPVSQFCNRFNIKDKRKELENIVTTKSENTRKALFPEEKRESWYKIFNANKKQLLQWSMSNVPSREILVLYNRDISKMHIYSMITSINKLMGEIVFTKGGFNIGDCVSFQRKGGNGKASKDIAKNSIKHPGNNIQIKLKMNKFIALMKEDELGSYIV